MSDPDRIAQLILAKLEARKVELAAERAESLPAPDVPTDPLDIIAVIVNSYLQFVRGWLTEIDRVVSESVTAEQAYYRWYYGDLAARHWHVPTDAQARVEHIADILPVWAALRGFVVSLDAGDHPAARVHAGDFVALANAPLGDWPRAVGEYFSRPYYGISPIAGFDPLTYAPVEAGENPYSIWNTNRRFAILAGALALFAETGSLTPRDATEAEKLFCYIDPFVMD